MNLGDGDGIGKNLLVNVRRGKRGSPPPLYFDWNVMMIRWYHFIKVMMIVMCTSATQDIKFYRNKRGTREERAEREKKERKTKTEEKQGDRERKKDGYRKTRGD
ncbi:MULTISPECIES: hypothetical protein [unclassified Methanoculleus]|uniref:hypothetical protein n=1 Tax=unclassified Methanoculleus TaxID=2619537 RepID=UPI0025EF1F8A|nr:MULTISPECIES: hypothetical protein [unclassified Methanoculleus]MCK9317520.1 hypothetical protein [Methanoculleus sp.]MDD2252928.1 hypothetical protein [Methanoculleus sp.]MDD2786970.1 hypothetical protein [Methanoculleus sp.]MDD3217267.1 hypothetical protein [Methanoculleus sp.]MDD4313653.1 hypothetical protein [Methanoculleus sp.]